MNYRTTIALIVILALVAGLGFVYTASRADRAPDVVGVSQQPFYLVDLEDIMRVEFNLRGNNQKFFRGADSQWYFDSPAREPVNLDRWGGIVLLVSGPRYERIISDSAPDLARYGLENPHLIVKAELIQLGEITIRVGDKTPDGLNHYALYQEERAIYLVAADWGDVFGRIVTNPPYMPTPTPETTPTPVPDATTTP